MFKGPSGSILKRMVEETGFLELLYYVLSEQKQLRVKEFKSPVYKN